MICYLNPALLHNPHRRCHIIVYNIYIIWYSSDLFFFWLVPPRRIGACVYYNIHVRIICAVSFKDILI